ncbi:unnamed protein product [Arctia plantaginis]|uniref:Uncharacterized protein n=1 Tax=Arctia plantaginis TaxID=874455 RepID=A0A8S0Z6A2_ARCPL|nr:unnamed protein product [Arctia plantaginis]
MACNVTVFLLLFVLLYIVSVNTATFDKKTVDGMILKTLWTKTYQGFDAKSKEAAIKQIRNSGDYDKLIKYLMKVKKEKLNARLLKSSNQSNQSDGTYITYT